MARPQSVLCSDVVFCFFFEAYIVARFLHHREVTRPCCCMPDIGCHSWPWVLKGVTGIIPVTSTCTVVSVNISPKYVHHIILMLRQVVHFIPIL